jgi:hypothetical protein
MSNNMAAIDFESKGVNSLSVCTSNLDRTI